MKKRYVTIYGRKNGKKTKIRFQVKENVILKRYEKLWDYIETNHPRIFFKFVGTILKQDKDISVKKGETK